MLDSSYQRVKRLFVFAHDNTAGDDPVSVDSYQKYLLSRLKVKIETLKLMEEIFVISHLMTQ